jgi:hypothetical protein
MKQWQDKGLYWANGEGPTPTKKTIDYAEIIYPNNPETNQKLAIGVWDDDKYTELHRGELDFHVKNGALISKGTK